MHFPYINETQEITRSFRPGVNGSFISLPDGYTHYELEGEKDANTVVLVHGFSVPYFIWDSTYTALLEAGYRVLRYDLFGRGYSDRPKTAYTLDLFARQLRDLLDALKITESINLCGLSMGGAISASFTARHPEQVKKLALFAPAGGKATPLSIPFKILLIPGIGELLMGLLGEKTLVDGIAEDFNDPQLIAHFTSLYRPQIKLRGFGRAILSTMRNDALRDSSATYRHIGQTGIPVLLVWGREDNTVPYEQSQEIVASIPQAVFHTIENSGHIPHYENADEVNPILLNFLQE